MTGFASAWLRLLVVQGAWNYERMTGVGLGYAAEPLLEDLKSADPGRHAEAAVRSAEYFNSHPYLAGLALGALVRAEYDQVPGPQIARLRTALTSPLGSLGDQLFWAGLVPAAVAIGLIGVAGLHAVWPLILAWLGFNLARAVTGVWALRTGLAHGARVGGAIGQSWIPAAARQAGLAAGALVGLALPLVAKWLLAPQPVSGWLLAFVVLLTGLAAGRLLGPRVTAVRFGLVAIGLALILAWSLP